MVLLGRISQLWGYPVKSMQGEARDLLRVDLPGIEGDRRFAFESVNAPVGKPLLRAAERSAMLRLRASIDHAQETRVQVETGEVLAIQDARLPALLGEPVLASEMRLLAATRPLTDVRPLSLHSVATERLLAAAFGGFDARRLRSNLVLDLVDNEPFQEETLVGRRIRLGDAVELLLLERIPRCRMVSLHPETAARDATILPWLARTRQGRIGIYARPLASGTIRAGDPVTLRE